MMRQASSRNQRNRGLRLTNVLQICLLAAVCFWLLYQLKHSYDKKKALDEQHPRILNNVEDGQPDFIDLGRKDLPRDKMMISGDKIHNKEEENDEIEEDEDGDAQRAMEDEEAKGVGDDGIDEEDNEQGDEQDDQERGDEETEETEDGEDSMNEENKDDHVDEAVFLVGQEHEEGSSQEAHEESYKRDDASSAVHRENQVTGTEDKNDSVGEEQLKNDEKVETRHTTSREDDGLNDHNNMSVALVVAISNDTIQNNSLTINSAAAERLEQELSPADNQTRLQANSTIESASYHQVKLQTDSPIDVTDNAAEGNTNTVLLENGALIRSSNNDQNITTGLGSPEEDNSILKSVVVEQPKKSNTNIGQDNLEELSTVLLAVNENGDAVEGDAAGSLHRMVVHEERDARIDLSTLPDIQIDVKNIEDEAAE